jgi:phosphatidate phosphatase PAH1
MTEQQQQQQSSTGANGAGGRHPPSKSSNSTGNKDSGGSGNNNNNKANNKKAARDRKKARAKLQKKDRPVDNFIGAVTDTGHHLLYKHVIKPSGGNMASQCRVFTNRIQAIRFLEVRDTVFFTNKKHALNTLKMPLS